MELLKTSEPKRILVTGANGFVAHHVINEFTRLGHTVYGIDVLDRRDDLSIEYEICSLLDKDTLRRLVTHWQPQVVIHLAAIHYIPYCNMNPIETFRVNVLGTQRLLDVLPLSLGLESVFFSSSAAVYTPSMEPHRETDATWPIDIYGFTKKAGEYIMRSWSQAASTPVVIGRYFNMYGWGETTPHLIPAIVQQVLSGHSPIKLGNIDTARDFVHVSDNARATVHAALHIRSESSLGFNMGSGVPSSARSILLLLSHILGREIEVVTDGGRVRKTDRPFLVADMTRYHMFRLPRARISLKEGLMDLLETGVGPYIKGYNL